jgi:hypothetical protein
VKTLLSQAVKSFTKGTIKPNQASMNKTTEGLSGKTFKMGKIF